MLNFMMSRVAHAIDLLDMPFLQKVAANLRLKSAKSLVIYCTVMMVLILFYIYVESTHPSGKGMTFCGSYEATRNIGID